MLKRAWIAYFVVVLALLTTSIVTGRRATAVAGNPHYLFTRTSVLVERVVEPSSDTEAALDALFEKAGETPTRTVEEPVFVLGLLDVTFPVSVAGLVIMGVLTLVARRRRSAAGKC